MDVTKGHLIEEVPPEMTEVGTVAEASWGDRDQLATWSELSDGERQECRVEVADLDTNSCQQPALAGQGVDLAVRGIHHHEVVSGFGAALAHGGPRGA